METTKQRPIPGDVADEVRAGPAKMELSVTDQKQAEVVTATTEQSLILRNSADEAQAGGHSAMEIHTTDQKHDERSRSTSQPPVQAKESGSENKQRTGARVHGDFVKTSQHLMSYISKLESRIERLEMNESKDDRLEHEGTRPIKPQTETTRFFLESDEPRFLLDSTLEVWEIPGTFLSEVDVHPLVRVLYRRIRPRSDDGQYAPNPKDIDILELRIASKHIADFLSRKFEYDLSVHGVLHLVKPFRTLIRSFSFIKEECNRLVRHR